MAHSSSRIARLEPARVCIIKPSSLGDVIHSLPILAALRERWPSAHITWLVNHSYQDVLLNHRHLNELIVYERAGQVGDSGGLVGTARLLSTLSRGRYDLTIDLQGLLRSAIMTLATMAKVRVGMADAREGARWFYTDLVDASRLRMHAVDRVIRVAGYLGATVDEPRLRLADRRSGQAMGCRNVGGGPLATDCAQPGCAVADQTVAARALRRNRAPRGLGIRRRIDRRRLAPRIVPSSTRCYDWCALFPSWIFAGAPGCSSSPPSPANPTL